MAEELDKDDAAYPLMPARSGSPDEDAVSAGEQDAVIAGLLETTRRYWMALPGEPPAQEKEPGTTAFQARLRLAPKRGWVAAGPG